MAGLGGSGFSASSGFSFGTGASTGLSFGATAKTAASTGIQLGSTTTSTASTTGSTFASGFSFPTQKTTSSTSGLSFGVSTAAGQTTTTSTPAPSGFGGTSLFGAKTTAATSSLGSGFLLGATTTAATTSSSSLFGSTTQAKSTFKGLGGTEPGVSGTNNNGNGNRNDVISQAVKDQAVPPEICKHVQSFEEYVAKQKAESSEIGKFSVRSLHKINEEISSITSALATILSAVQRNKATVEKLRSEFSEQLQHAEMAKRTQDIPPTLQHDNIAPLQYFVDLVNDFGSRMQTYRQQIEQLENHLHSLSLPSTLTPQDISVALCKIQESFITLASNLHSVHDNVKRIKEQYLAYRRVVHGDPSDIFSARSPDSKAGSPRSPPRQGPPPLSNMSNVAALAMATMLQQPQQQQQQQAPPSQSFFKSAFNAGATTSNPFGGASTSGGLFGAAKTTSSTMFGSTNTLKPTLSAGFNAASSSGNVFFGNTSFNSSAGVTFGGAALGKSASFDLKQPPAGNKRNRK